MTTLMTTTLPILNLVLIKQGKREQMIYYATKWPTTTRTFVLLLIHKRSRDGGLNQLIRSHHYGIN